eukprot:3217296-Prymnesium_polylepis.1
MRRNNSGGIEICDKPALRDLIQVWNREYALPLGQDDDDLVWVPPGGELPVTPLPNLTANIVAGKVTTEQVLARQYQMWCLKRS